MPLLQRYRSYGAVRARSKQIQMLSFSKPVPEGRHLCRKVIQPIYELRRSGTAGSFLRQVFECPEQGIDDAAPTGLFLLYVCLCYRDTAPTELSEHGPNRFKCCLSQSQSRRDGISVEK